MSQESDVVEKSEEQEIPSTSSLKKKYGTPAQDQLKEEICSLGQEILLLKQKDNANLSTDKEKTLLREKQERQQQLEKNLKKCKQNMRRQEKFRDIRKRNLTEILDENPALKKRLHTREKVSTYLLKK